MSNDKAQSSVPALAGATQNAYEQHGHLPECIYWQNDEECNCDWKGWPKLAGSLAERPVTPQAEPGASECTAPNAARENWLNGDWVFSAAKTIAISSHLSTGMICNIIQRSYDAAHPVTVPQASAKDKANYGGEAPGIENGGLGEGVRASAGVGEPRRKCLDCGIEVTACNSHVLADQLVKAVAGEIPFSQVQERCPRCEVKRAQASAGLSDEEIARRHAREWSLDTGETHESSQESSTGMGQEK